MCLPQHVSTCHCILPLSADPPCILGTLGRQEMKSCNVSLGRCGNQVAKLGHSRKCPLQLLLHLAALFRQFNSSTPDALLCTALASSGLGKGGQEVGRAFAQGVTLHAFAHCTFAHCTAHSGCHTACHLHIQGLLMQATHHTKGAMVQEH